MRRTICLICPRKISGIDAIHDSAELRINKKAEQLKKQPYSEIGRDEVLGITEAIRDREYFGHISKPVADSYVKKAEQSAGIAKEKKMLGEPTEAEIASGGYEKHLARKNMKAKAESKAIYFQNPTAGKQIADYEHETLYQKMRRLFSRK